MRRLSSTIGSVLLASCHTGPEGQAPIAMEPGAYHASLTGSAGRSSRLPGFPNDRDLCLGGDPLTIPQRMVEQILVGGRDCELTRLTRRGNLISSTTTCTRNNGHATGTLELAFEGVVNQTSVVGSLHLKPKIEPLPDEVVDERKQAAMRAGMAMVGLISIGVAFERTGYCVGSGPAATGKNPWAK